MRYLTLSIIILWSFGSHAGNWMSSSDMVTARSGGSGYQIYTHQGACQNNESEACYNLSNKDIRYHTVQNLRRGNFEPASFISECADRIDCQAAISDAVAKCGDSSYSALWGDLDGDSTVDKDGISAMDDLESWCTRREFMAVLEEDSSLKAAAQTSDSNKATEMANRKSKRQARVAQIIDNCGKAPGPANLAEARACIRALAKEMMREKMAEADL